jgi:NH3-dependent NAD+ synthetase
MERWIHLMTLEQKTRFLDATPTAELEPITENYVQADEADMGMTYEGILLPTPICALRRTRG